MGRLLRSLATTVATGLAVGGLGWGGAISFLHLIHNRPASPFAAVAALGFFVALYGGGVGAAFGLGWLLVQPWVLLRQRASNPERARELGGWLGLLGFNLVFWELWFLYGLTYQQTLWVEPEGFAGMAAYLGLAALVIALLVVLAARLLHRALEALHRRSALGSAAGAAASVLLLVHLLVPLLDRLPAPAATAATAGGNPLRQPAGPAAVQPSPRPFKVVLLGLDGADPAVLRRLLEEGQLPTFERLVRGGVLGELATLPDANSAVIWASIYTGARPEVHGVLDFYRIELPGVRPGLYPVHRSYFKEAVDLLAPTGLVRRVSVTRGDVGAPLLWEIAAGAGLSVGVVDGYFYSFPAQPIEHGFFLAYGLDAYARLQGSGELDLGDLRLFVHPKEVFPRVSPVLDRPDFYWQSEALLRLLEHHPQPHFVSLYTHEPDTVQHQYWKWLEPERFFGVKPEELERNRDRIPSVYRDFDRFLARLLDTLDPSTALLLVSDHGHAATIAHQYQSQHRHGPPGVVLLFGPPMKAGYTLEGSHVLDLYPTLLHLLGLPVPEDAGGRVLAEALDEGFVRLNPVRTLPSYQGLFGSAAGGERRSRLLDQEEIEKLKKLGYL